jgi:hypothetical protein
VWPFDPTSDTTSIVYKGFKSISALNVVEKDPAELIKDLEKGKNCCDHQPEKRSRSNKACFIFI